MTKVPKRDKQRDADLIGDYNSGTPMYLLNSKYKISSTRIYQILDHYEIPRRTKKK